MGTPSRGLNIATADQITAREDAGRVLHIRDEFGEPLFTETNGPKRPVTITIAGSYSKRYRAIEDAITGRILKKRQARLTTEQLADNRVDLVAGCVLAWDGIENDGVALPCTPENAALVVRGLPWVRTQLQEAQDEHEGFSESASAS